MTRRQRQILGMLAENGQWLNQATLKASNATMHHLWLNGWVQGAGLPDKKGTGNYPWSSVWKITPHGRQKRWGVR